MYSSCNSGRPVGYFAFEFESAFEFEFSLESEFEFDFEFVSEIEFEIDLEFEIEIEFELECVWMDSVLGAPTRDPSEGGRGGRFPALWDRSHSLSCT